MNLLDYKPGTAYILLCADDFKNKERFASIAKFMGQNEDCVIEIPIDSQRAIKLSKALRDRKRLK